MYCRKCGKSILDDSIFCSYCGCETGLSAATAKSSLQDKGKSKNHLLNLVVIIALTLNLAVSSLICVFIAFTFHREPDVEESASSTPSTVSKASTVEALSEEEHDPEYMQWQMFDTLEDGIAATGIDLTIPELLDGFDVYCLANKGKHGIQAWEIRADSTIIEEILILKTIGSGNNNVNDYEYNEEKVMSIGGNDVTFHLQDGNVSLAYWNIGEYAYSLLFRNFPVDLDAAIEMILHTK